MYYYTLLKYFTKIKHNLKIITFKTNKENTVNTLKLSVKP